MEPRVSLPLATKGGKKYHKILCNETVFCSILKLHCHSNEGAGKAVLSERAFSQKVLWLIEEVCLILLRVNLFTPSQSSTHKNNLLPICVHH